MASSSTTKNPPEPTPLSPQFINVTDPTSLDKSSRTQVRVQVMRDYHRRRTQKAEGKESSRSEPNQPRPALSAKAQTQKFRLGREKVLRPWVPVKSGGKRQQKAAAKTPAAANTGRKRLARNQDSDHQIETGNFPLNDAEFEYFDLDTFDFGQTADDGLGSEFFDDTNMEQTGIEIEQWLSSLEFSLQKSILHHSPASGVLDPFSAMALVITPRTQVLLYYYFNLRLESSWLMMPMRKGIFSLAVHDEAMFHTFLTHYVASYNSRFHVTDQTELLYHRNITIKLVNQRLTDTPHILSDGTIAAVANMAAYECSNGSTESVLVHLNGLERMVNMRGGITNGGFPPHLRRLLGWTDFHCANALFQKPRFPPLAIPVTKEPDPGATSVSSPLYISPPDWSSPIPDDPFLGSDFYVNELSGLFSGIKDLHNTMRILRCQPVMPQENIWYSDRIYYLQRGLFEIMFCPKSEGGSLDSALAIAGIMFCGNCLRDIPLTFEVFKKAVARLKSVIQDLEDCGLLIDDPQVDHRLFWAIGFGGVAAEGKPERAWYVAKFRKLCDARNILDWGSAKAVLGAFLWDSSYDDAGHLLWVEANVENYLPG